MTVTILTVDDSRTMRDMLRMALVDAGFRVVQAEDGLHGLDVLREEQPHVVITDINMPRMDGFGFIEAVRREDYGTVAVFEDLYGNLWDLIGPPS